MRVVDGTRCGACFEVWLPVKARSSRPSPVPLPPRKRGGRRARVLVIDDEPAILRAIDGVLAGVDNEVVLAGGGSEALAVLREDSAFDAVLCDLHMPDVDGIAVHAWLLAHHPERMDRLVFLTADSVSDRARQFVAAVDPVLVMKPISAAELEWALAPLLGSLRG